MKNKFLSSVFLCAMASLLPPGAAYAQTFEARPAAPVLFTPLDERSATFTADGNTVYFAIRVGDGAMQALCVSTREGGQWSEPQVLPFSGEAVYDADPFITPDGHTLYFASSRSTDGKPKRDLDIWVVQRTTKDWGTPQPVAGVNSPATDRSPVLTPSGNLYFASTRTDGGDFFVAKPQGLGFAAPVQLDIDAKVQGYKAMLAVSPDEKTVVFAALARADETLAPGRPYPRGDLYVSHWVVGAWTASMKLGATINTNASELSPSFSPDGSMLYFMSERGFATDQTVTLDYVTLMKGLKSSLNGRGNIYAIDAKALEAQP